MDIQSFYRLTPDEFEMLYDKWSELRDAEFKNRWEQTRKLCYWAGKQLKPNVSIKAFMPFPWDKAKDKSKKTKGNTKIHDPERFERLKKEYGATI